MTVVKLASERLAAPDAAVRVGAPRVERETGAVLGAHAAAGREQRFRAGPFRACASPDRASADASSCPRAGPPRGWHLPRAAPPPSRRLRPSSLATRP